MQRENFQTFSLKFIDIMVGVVLGLGFQWWPDLKEPWQYIAFFFVYINLIDYWIDYSPTLKQFPPRRELDIITHLFTVFTMFLLVYATRGTATSFFITFIVFRLADLWWLWEIRRTYKMKPEEAIFVNTWFWFGGIEMVGSGLLFLMVGPLAFFHPLVAIIVFVAFRTGTRVFASLRYKKVFFR